MFSRLWLWGVPVKLLATAVKQFSAINLFLNLIVLAVKRTHMKEILYVDVVIVDQQAAWVGWGRSLFLGVCLLWWIFQQRPSNNKKESKPKNPLKKLFIIPFLCHIYSLPPSLMGVMWMFAASRLLVCDACCGLSVGTFKSALLAAVEPQNKRA